jgi:hypothetical protein
MRVKEFIYLATLLLVGLLVNHCAFKSDISQFEPARSLLTVGERVEQRAEDMDRHMEQVSKDLDEKMERLDNKLEEAGERLDGTGTEGGIEKSTQVPSADGTLNITVTYKLPSEDNAVDSLMFIEIPSDLMLTLGETETGKLDLNEWGSSEMKSPIFTVQDDGQLRIELSDGKMPDKADVALPSEITEITFGADEAMLLTLEPSGAELHLDSAVENITIKRSGEWVTLTSPYWTIRLKGMKPDLKVVGAEGNDLGELKAVGTTEITYDAPKDDEGGAQ